MSIIYRDTNTWVADSSHPTADVIGDESEVIGVEADDASVWLKLMFGDPIQQLLRFTRTEAMVTRRVKLDKIVR